MHELREQSRRLWQVLVVGLLHAPLARELELLVEGAPIETLHWRVTLESSKLQGAIAQTETLKFTRLVELQLKVQ